MSQYQILITEEPEKYPLAPRSGKVFMALRKLQVASTYYTDEERYAFIREMRWEDEWVEDKSEENETVRIKDPTLSYDEFINQATELLFPAAPIEENVGDIDFEVAGEAIEDFTKRTGRKKRKLTDFLS